MKRYFKLEFKGEIHQIPTKRSVREISLWKKLLRYFSVVIPLPDLWFGNVVTKEFSGYAFTTENPDYVEDFFDYDPGNKIDNAVANYFRLKPPYCITLTISPPSWVRFDHDQRKDLKRAWFLP